MQASKASGIGAGKDLQGGGCGEASFFPYFYLPYAHCGIAGCFCSAKWTGCMTGQEAKPGGQRSGMQTPRWLEAKGEVKLDIWEILSGVDTRQIQYFRELQNK